MGADKKKVANLFGEVFGDDIAKTEITMEEAGKITQAILCKAIHPDTEDEAALDIVKRGRAFVSEIAGQEGVTKKADDSDKEITVYSVEKLLAEAIVKDVEGVELSGSWGSNMDALKKKFESSDGGSDADNDSSANEGDRDDANKSDGDEDNGQEDEKEEDVWGNAFDLNKKANPEEDWGKDPDEIKD